MYKSLVNTLCLLQLANEEALIMHIVHVPGHYIILFEYWTENMEEVLIARFGIGLIARKV